MLRGREHTSNLDTTSDSFDPKTPCPQRNFPRFRQLASPHLRGPPLSRQVGSPQKSDRHAYDGEMGPVVNAATTVLAERDWRARAEAHEQRVDRWITPHLERRRLGVAHPVEDFLFTYYSYRPASLRRWHPGLGVELEGDVSAFEGRRGYAVRAGRAAVDMELAGGRADRITWIRDLLAATASRPAMLGCFGLHEWAMVYGQSPDGIRHAAYPLRARRRLQPTRSWRRTGSRARTSTPFGSSPSRPVRSTSRSPPGRRSNTSTNRAACTPRWTSTSGPTSSRRSPAGWWPTASRWPARSGRSTCRRRPTTSAHPRGRADPIETPEGKQRYVAHQRRLRCTVSRPAPASGRRLRPGPDAALTEPVAIPGQPSSV